MPDPSSIKLRDVVGAADSFIEKYNADSVYPLPIEEIIERDLGIRIILVPGLDHLIGVSAFISQSFDSIVIDEKMYCSQPNRVIFTLAEEIGHYFLHREWYGGSGPNGIEEYLSWHTGLDQQKYKFIEHQARTFASMILMPEGLLKKSWNSFKVKYSLSDPCTFEELASANLSELAEEYGVSPESMMIRLGHLKLVEIPDWYWDRKQ